MLSRFALAFLLPLILCHGVLLRSIDVNSNLRGRNSTFMSRLASNDTSAGQHGDAELRYRGAVNASANTSDRGSLAENRPARIYFLFMAIDKISNFAVWKSFFANAPSSRYGAFVHCKLPACNAFLAGSVFFQVVPTVPSYYCTDLVSPMNRLLLSALQDDPSSVNAADKFAFISDSSLPAKPFSYIYSTLSMRPGSAFCVFPSAEWADYSGGPPGGLEIAVKAQQWMVLERAHAEKAVGLWSSGQWHNLMAKFQMNTHAFAWNNNTYGDHRNFGCLDEFWHFVALFGTLHSVDTTVDSTISLSHFTSSPLRISQSTGWQGACDTFVIWEKYMHIAGNNPFSRLHMALDPVSVPHGGNSYRPGWWDTISTHGMQAIRNSDFLFVRKFIDNPRLAQQSGDFTSEYARIVCSD